MSASLHSVHILVINFLHRGQTIFIFTGYTIIIRERCLCLTLDKIFFIIAGILAEGYRLLPFYRDFLFSTSVCARSCTHRHAGNESSCRCHRSKSVSSHLHPDPYRTRNTRSPHHTYNTYNSRSFFPTSYSSPISYFLHYFCDDRDAEFFFSMKLCIHLSTVPSIIHAVKKDSTAVTAVTHTMRGT